MGTLVRKVALLLAGVLVGTMMLAGAAYAKLFVGKEAADTFNGTSATDVMYGLNGSDRLEGRGGADEVYGGRGNDALYGNGGGDYLNGGRGSDALLGNWGNDRIEAADGSNRNDLVKCGPGNEDRASVDDNDLVVGCEFVNGRRR
jgi:Ca2+-binding RTX toxin-like protein